MRARGRPDRRRSPPGLRTRARAREPPVSTLVSPERTLDRAVPFRRLSDRESRVKTGPLENVIYRVTIWADEPQPAFTRERFLRRAAVAGAALLVLGRADATSFGAVAAAADGAGVRLPSGSESAGRDRAAPRRRSRAGIPLPRAVVRPGAARRDDRRRRGRAVWFHPTSPNTVMNLRVALYRGEPVLTWWEGVSEHGLGVGEHVDLRPALPRDRALPGRERTAVGSARADRHAAGHGLRHGVRHPDRRPVERRPRPRPRDRGRRPGDRDPEREGAIRVAKPRPREGERSRTRRSLRVSTTSTSTRSTSTATGTCSSPRATRGPSTRSTAGAERCSGGSAGRRATSPWAREPRSRGSTTRGITGTATRSSRCSTTARGRRRSSRSRAASRSRST